jgi:hypothetical protein
MKPMRIAFVFGVAGLGLWAGGITGVLWALICFGMLLFVWYALFDAAKGVDNYLKGPRQLDVTVHQGDSIKGHPDVEGRAWRENPDPTRPTEEDWAGLLTYRIAKKDR